VDRTAKILPWDSQEAARSLSPVEVSARFLAKFREEWDKSGKPDLAAQNIVLTVPASFDEEGRELTVEAARQAGLPQLTLIEEPAAAFYSWIAGNLTQSRKRLFDGQTVLICDVGGGTSDFSLIRVGRENDRIEFTRTAVGRHLLLGGDNLDLTLGWLVENKLGVPLSLRQRSGMRRQCSSAKEKLLSDPKLASVEITVLGSGSSLVGKTLKTEILREEALELTLEGFLPLKSAVCSVNSACRMKPIRRSRSIWPRSSIPRVRFRTRFCSTEASSSRRSAANASRTRCNIGTENARRFSTIATWTWPWRAARLITATCVPPVRASSSEAVCRVLTSSA
jgi:molecular chaperone DnaK (HSP70)